MFCATAQGSGTLFAVMTGGPQQAWEPGLVPWLLVQHLACQEELMPTRPTCEGVKDIAISAPWPSLLLSTQWDIAEARQWPLLQARQLAVSGDVALGLGATS